MATNVCTFDLEIQKEIEEVEGGWDAARRGLCGMASGVVYSTASGRYHLYDTNGVDRLADQLEAADLVVSFNGGGFDVPMLSGVAARWISLPRHYDILAAVWQAVGKKVKGYGLAALCQRTLGLDKNGNGCSAPKLFKAGRFAELLDYNLNDVFLTRQLFNHIHDHQYIIDIDGNQLTVEAPHDYGHA